MNAKQIRAFFKNVSLDTEVVLYPYNNYSDISALIDTPLVGDGRYLVFYKSEERNLKKLSGFVGCCINFLEPYYIRLVPVSRKSPTYSLLVVQDGAKQVLLDEKHSFNEWVLKVISKLKEIEIFEKPNSIIQWQKKIL